MKRLSASILAADALHLDRAVADAERAGVEWIHVDVMDGHFVPNLTMGPQVVEALRRATRLPLDVHLMIEEPDRYLEAFISAGADWVSVHAEVARHLDRTLARIRELGAHPSVTLNPATPLDALDHALGDTEMVLLMSVNPGFAGQAFIPAVLSKIRALRGRIDAAGANVLIEVDGGLNPETIGSVAAAGADVLVAGSAIFNSRPVEENVRALRRAILPQA
jgi:ribulose-phosphate 3-epimerase